MKEFAHLHVHTSSSLLDGITLPTRMLEEAGKKGIEAIALTDHGSMGGHLEAQVESKNIENCPKIIFGSEVYVVPDRHDKEKGMDRRHLILLAKNEEGYKNLTAINNEGWRNFYYRPRVDFDFISQHSKGLIATSACAKGVVGEYLTRKDIESAANAAMDYKEVFGGDFYLEIQLINVTIDGHELQDHVNKGTILIGNAYNIPIIISNDVHYVNEADWILHEKMLHMHTGNIDWSFGTKDIWLKTWDELNDARQKYLPSLTYKSFKKMMGKTLEIAGKCDHSIETGQAHIPNFDYVKHPEYRSEKTKEEFFIGLMTRALRRFLRGIPKTNHATYRERLLKEVDGIIQMKAIDYFLIVEDLVRFVRGQNKLIMIRGSANGSLVCYLLRFGHIDPVKQNILFERFMSPARIETGMFDVDIDIDMERDMRPKAVAYLKEKYGDDKICNVGSYGRMMWKAAIKDMGRVEAFEAKGRLETVTHPSEKKDIERTLDNFSFAQMNQITKLLEASSQQEGGEISIEETRKNQPIFDAWYKKNESWIKTYVEPIIGLPKSPSIHPASVIVLPSGMDDWLPIRSQKSPQDKKTRVLCTQWEGSHTGREDLRTYGVMALDILGVKTLNVIADTMTTIQDLHGHEIGMEDIPLDDIETIKRFKKGETLGVFQLGAPGITKIIKGIKPDNFNDVVNLCAIDRPGPLSIKAHVAYGKRKHGEERVERLHKSIDPIIKEAYGLPIFNDHIMQIGMAFAGFTPVEAEELRIASKAKKGKESMAHLKAKFIDQAIKLHGEEARSAATQIWKKIELFGAYSFPKAHATGYGLVAWATMFLKANYPTEFFCNLLNYSDHDKFAEIRRIAMKHYDVRFLMPDVNISGEKFTIRKGRIIWSLSGIKGIGPSALTNLIKHRPYSSFEDFYKRVDKRQLNKARMEALIFAGCLRKFGKPLDLIQQLYKMRHKEKKKGDYNSVYDEYKKEDWLKLKTEYLGFQMKSFLDMYEKTIETYGVKTLGEFDKAVSGMEMKIVGQVINIKSLSSKNGPYLRGRLTDIDGTADFFMWNDEYRRHQKKKSIPKDGDVILLSGKKKEWNRTYSIHANNIKIIST
jgi:DNA polymerase-3 subunit alpha